MTGYLESAIKQFEYYKVLGEKAMRQVPAGALFYVHNDDSNSIAVIVQHLYGNMMSRWTDFLTSDGEKEWRNRDAEFESVLADEQELWARWEQGWAVLFGALRPLTDSDLDTVVYIRNQGHTVTEAINRQIAHYAYHVGQIVFLAKMLSAAPWQSLSIPRGGSGSFNKEKFEKPKERAHFTDEFVATGAKSKALEYIEKVHARTRKAVLQIPADGFDYSYAPGKFTLGDLVRHIAATQRFMFAEIAAGRPSVYVGSGREVMEGYASTVEYFDAMFRQTMDVLGELSDADMERKCITPAGISLSVWKWLRAMTEHEIHHRGQISVYLGLLSRPVEPIFALTDEQISAHGRANKDISQ